jgi:threonine dehydrogenase-like Zn-dependent dehydrogenase
LHGRGWIAARYRLIEALMSEFRALVFPAPGAAPVFHAFDAPDVVNGALIAVLSCALDAEDARALSGGGGVWPVIPGRFFVGVVESLGAGLTEDVSGQRLRPGTPVLVPSIIPCGICETCRTPQDHAAFCLAPTRLGVDHARNVVRGGLSKFVAPPPAPIHALPLTFPLPLATLAEDLATAIGAFARAQAVGRFAPGCSVVIAGSGASALLAIIAALELGAGRVVTVGGPEIPFLRLARQFGAEATIDAADPRLAGEITRETLGGRGADVVLHLGDSAIEPTTMAREGGVIIVRSALAPAPLGTWRAIADRQLAVLGARGFAGRDIGVALRMLQRQRGRYDLDALHSVVPFTANGVGSALAALQAGTMIRALVTIRTGWSA